MIKTELSHDGRRHGRKAKAAPSAPPRRTVVRFESRSQVYCWTSDRALRPVIKH